ncbi:hypothetical protein CROQUDRAFT_664004 [Cronartium quercuum f. sp. fusiforme G11]|uniref:Uncharacterized protein n=1 Tax=Cronartium quercuum f. sp. fusiforme G11 TaxID=708437 RepID=A0A9P6N7K3_9BASI|nr:hypothetical protein CROQUDRAFT_664004 [Cronartium quercuum f. sp. fusiforme G11]
MTGLLSSLALTSLKPDEIVKEILNSYQSLQLDPDIYPSLASQAAKLSPDLDQALIQHLNTTLDHQTNDSPTSDLDRESEFENLQAHIQSSRETLERLTDFLTAFQSDLSTVSSSISELQGRSKSIETRLDARRLVLSDLKPYISNTFLPPQLITTILQTEPGESWVEPINSLESKLTNLHSTHHAHPAADVAEKLRLVAADKIRGFFLNALKPFRVSISPNLQITQASIFLKHRTLFGFLQRHAARIAHEVQKAYVGTVRWYLETGLRRYVRALEKVRVRGWPKAGLIGNPTGVIPAQPQSIIPYAFIEGPDPILAHMTESATYKQSPEALFRSLSLVVADNIGSEYNFVKQFFGLPPISVSTSPTTSEQQQTSTIPRPPPSVISSVAETTTSESSVTNTDPLPVLEHVWYQIVAPVLEYHHTFTSTLLESNPETSSLYAMISLNNKLLIRSSNSFKKLENHFINLKLKIWPRFQILINNEIHSISNKKNFNITSSKTYSNLINSLIGMMNKEEKEDEEEEEKKVIYELLKLRNLIDNFGSQEIWKQILNDLLGSGPSSTHSHLLAEVAHWKEMIRRAEMKVGARN